MIPSDRRPSEQLCDPLTGRRLKSVAHLPCDSDIPEREDDSIVPKRGLPILSKSFCDSDDYAVLSIETALH